MSDTDTPTGSGAVTIVVDVHEPEEIENAALFHPDADGVALNHPLESADLIVNGIGFERKTPSDYANSLTGGRLKGQVAAMADAFDHAYILVEGDVGDFETLGHSGIDAAALRGSVASFAARDGVHTVFCGDAETLVDMAVRLGRKHTEAPSSVHIPTPDVDDAPVTVKILACVDGVGPETARAIVDEFADVPTVLDAIDSDVLTTVDGVGPKTAATIEESLTGQP